MLNSDFELNLIQVIYLSCKLNELKQYFVKYLNLIDFLQKTTGQNSLNKLNWDFD